MLLLTNAGSAPDKLQLVTSAAVTVDVHASYVDASNANPPVVQGDTMGRQNTAITTATTTDIVAAPAANEIRNVKTLHVRNKHASSSVDVTVVYDANGTDYELHKATLRAGEALEYVEGIGFFTLATSAVLTDASTAQQGAGFSVDTYLTDSALACGNPTAKTLYVMTFDVTKTAAGTAQPIIRLRLGTTGSTSDTVQCQFQFGAGTAAVDTARVMVEALFRTVGSGTSAVIQGRASAIKNLTTTGWSNAVGVVLTTSSGFDSTPTGNIIGVSYLGGTSASHTVQLVMAELRQM